MNPVDCEFYHLIDDEQNNEQVMLKVEKIKQTKQIVEHSI